uniref:Uncharacterized protein n=1 Tax=Moniliophthora roreri TaxID=221103 RepID=A0A0W0F965_MONRR
MALRRLAQNNAAAVGGSPAQPITPKPRPRQSIGVHQSPASTPSISSSIPFDWEAARLRRPAPYATPGRKSASSSTSATGTPVRKAVIRKKSFIEKIKSIPSRIAFEIALFPHNVPLPSSKTSAFVLGGLLHFIHLCVRISQSRSMRGPDSEWNNMIRDSEGSSWFDWTVPMTILLLGGSIMNVIYAFTRIRLYRLHRKVEPVTSPNVKYVNADLDFEPLEPPPLMLRVQLNVTVAYYTQLVKDKDILAAEVMNEYNEGFVYPRINPIRKDVAIMTHQSEVVNVWED